MTIATHVMNTITCDVCDIPIMKKSYRRHLKKDHLLKTGSLMKIKCHTCDIEVPQKCFNTHSK